MNAADQRRLTPWLVVACLLLAVAWIPFALGLGRGVHWKPPRPADPLPASAHVKTAQAPPLAEYAAIWQRPLFTVTRQPAPEAAGGGRGVSLGNLELTGVILAPGLHVALLRDRSDGHGVRVREGAQLAGGAWILSTLKPRSAEFVDHGRRARLTLKVPAHAASTSASARQPAHLRATEQRIKPRRSPPATHAGDH